ncbi:hypothetical protein VME0621_03872 [Vibrio mediterranei]|uniref:hypothetical protein n=1 Tax=Vibrio mediterranei TaxID=689 RepID=UPI0007F528BF|nr:hypothetical protein [Vibrio mediterranei]SBO11736.1 hypothetical protein VME0621_03872 [Vibrio mediterranei]
MRMRLQLQKLEHIEKLKALAEAKQVSPTTLVIDLIERAYKELNNGIKSDI